MDEKRGRVITVAEMLEVDAVLARYVVRPEHPGVLREAATAEQRAAHAVRLAAYEAASAVVDRAARHARFSAGLARNVNLIKPEMATYREAMRTERGRAYVAAVEALRKERLEPDAVNARLAALAQEHDVAAIQAEEQARHAELVGEPTAIRAWYRMPLSYLPGWADGERPEAEQRGAVDPLDVALFLRVGILYDADEA